MRTARKIILASASRRRAALLASAGIPVEPIPSGLPEEFRPDENVQERVRRLAEAKARVVAGFTAERFFIGADTAVVCGGEMMGKPRDGQDAARMLRKLSGGAHEVTTGVAIYDAERDRLRMATVTTRVYVKRLRPEEISAYIETGCPFDKAGAYGIQGRAAYMVERIEGSYTNVVGLPLCETVEALVRAGAISYARPARS
jgi:nucleoside triphosphate pyrophosphatase